MALPLPFSQHPPRLLLSVHAYPSGTRVSTVALIVTLPPLLGIDSSMWCDSILANEQWRIDSYSFIGGFWEKLSLILKWDTMMRCFLGFYLFIYLFAAVRIVWWCDVWGGRNHLATVRQASQGRGDVLRMAEGKEKRKSGSLMMMLSCRINLFWSYCSSGLLVLWDKTLSLLSKPPERSSLFLATEKTFTDVWATGSKECTPNVLMWYADSWNNSIG